MSLPGMSLRGIPHARSKGGREVPLLFGSCPPGARPFLATRLGRSGTSSRPPFAGARRARARGGHSCRGHRSERWNRLGRIRIRTGGRFDSGRPVQALRAFPAFSAFCGRSGPITWWSTDGRPGFTYFAYCARRFNLRLVFVCALDAEIDGGFRRENPLRGFLFERGMRLSDARFAIAEHQARLFRERGMPCAVTRLLLPPAKFAAPDDKVHRPPLGRALPSREATAPLPRSRGTLCQRPAAG